MAPRVTGMPAPRRPGAISPPASRAAALGLAAFLAAGPASATTPNASLVLGTRFEASESGRPSSARHGWSPGSASGARGRWLSLSGLMGSAQPDPGLADYQWDTTPRLAWGLKAMAGRGGYAAGLRLWRTRATQTLGSVAETDPVVVGTSLELVGSARLASVWGTDVLASGAGGWLRLAYRPDEQTIDTGGGGTVVRFAPIDEWIGGVGLGVRRPVTGPWALGVDLEHRRFALDTAYRSGSGIVTSRPTFGEWSARLEVAWTRGW